MIISTRIFPMFLMVLFLGCKSSVDPDLEIKNILQLNEDQRTAHMTGDADLFVKQMADSITTIQDGEIYKNSKEETLKSFSQYFKEVRYNKWDDILKPRVNLSPDGKMATLITKKEVQAGQINTPDSIKYDTSYWAWMVSYVKWKGEWKLYAISSGSKQ